MADSAKQPFPFENISIESFEPSEYASSINNTPPKHWVITLFVLIAVCPKYCPQNILDNYC
jgi:hypothetical protein